MGPPPSIARDPHLIARGGPHDPDFEVRSVRRIRIVRALAYAYIRPGRH